MPCLKHGIYKKQKNEKDFTVHNDTKNSNDAMASHLPIGKK